MAYPFVAAKYDYGPRKGPALALVLHMAEGGNTVSYLHNAPARGVSVHFVAEYSGRMVQMLGLDRISGSINPAQLRTDDGPAPYGASVARQVLGPKYTDPNSAVITVEIEGFAKTGPNLAQHNALRAWATDMRSKLLSLTGALGHRDFQNYKACPGALIKWDVVGGHGLWHSGGGNVPAGGGDVITELYSGTLVTSGKPTRIYPEPTIATPPIASTLAPGTKLTMLGKTSGWRRVVVSLGGAWSEAWVRADEATGEIPDASLQAAIIAGHCAVPAAGDCSAQVKAEHDKVKAEAVAAVEAIP